MRLHRLHKVRQTIRGVLNRTRVSGHTLEVVMGHATFAVLSNRAALSVFCLERGFGDLNSVPARQKSFSPTARSMKISRISSP